MPRTTVPRCNRQHHDAHPIRAPDSARIAPIAPSRRGPERGAGMLLARRVAGGASRRLWRGCGSWRTLSTAPQIFDEAAKVAQKARAAAAANARDFDYLRDEAAAAVVSRICDIRRSFPVAVDLGCGSGHVRRALSQDSAAHASIGELIEVDAHVGCAGRHASDLPRRIPLADGAAALMVSACWLHWVNDLGGALREARRVLAPDGVLLAAMACGETLRELRIALQTAEMEVSGGFGPRVSPFVRARDAGDALSRAGFVMATVDVESLVVRYADMWALMRHLRAMGESNAVRARKPHVARAALHRAAVIYQEQFAHPLGGVTATFEICHMIGWKPAAGQQTPLQRGAAQFSLADLVSKE